MSPEPPVHLSATTPSGAKQRRRTLAEDALNLPNLLTLARVVPPAAALIPQPLLRLRLLLLDAALALEDGGVGMVSMAMRQPMSTTLSIPVRVPVMVLCRRMS